MVASKKRNHEGKPQSFEKTLTKVPLKISYVSLEKVIVIPKTEIVEPKRRNPLYYLVLILLEFRNQYGRDPTYDKKEDDIAKLLEIRDKVLPMFQVAKGKVKDDLFSLLFGELVTISSVVGGLMAQEVIKAVSHSGVPINNVFLFDPVKYNGREETVELKI